MELKSDIGAKSAWKGFSSQTLYIAYRLMILEDEMDMYPETVEDLMIKKNEKIKELIQIKNLSKKLSLSDLKPQEEDSFFKRVLKYKKENVIIKVVSFGDIGEEFQGVIKRNQKDIDNFKAKMLSYGYTLEDVDWILKNLSIEKENEKCLEKEIYSKLRENFKTSIESNIIFNNLINYISKLSRYTEMTNRKIWNIEVDRVINDIMSIKGMYNQYGRTIVNLREYKSQKKYEQLEKEYRMGIDARPDHIRNNLDIYRKKWMNKIKYAFKEKNVVIIRGASGQGKSTLAYRYLLDNYSEDFIFAVEHITDSKQAEDIVLALNGLFNSESGDTIIYIDVSPYDTNWKWILEQIDKRGINLKILITIREEDYRRTDFSYGGLKLQEIELKLEEDEAKEIYNLYEGSEKYLNFEDAWNSFRKEGPFMEFMYLLKEKQTLTERLNTQVDNIIEKENDSDEWLKFLLIVSYAGKENFRIDLKKISDVIKSKSMGKMLKNLEDEYLIRIKNNSNYIISTHAVRATILVNIIKTKLYYDENNLIIDVLKCTKDYCPILLIEYLYKNVEKSELLISTIKKEKDYDWSTYATIINSLLWLDTFVLYNKKSQDIELGNKYSNDNFIALFVQDCTGYLNVNRKEIFELYEKFNFEAVQSIKKEIKLEEFKIDYYYTDLFIKDIGDNIENKNVYREDDLSNVGYVLFWMANRNVFISNLKIIQLDYSKIDELLDFMVGLQLQDLEDEYNRILENIKKIIIKRYNIVWMENDQKEVSVKFINKLDDKHDSNFYDRTMDVVYCIRRLYFKKQMYNVKMIGTRIIDGLVIPDTNKTMQADKLIISWVTNINRQLLDLDEYKKRKDDWKAYKMAMNETNNLLLEFVKKYNTALDYFYRKTNISKLADEELNNLFRNILIKSKNMYKAPKCTVNKYGMSNELKSFSIREKNNENIYERNKEFYRKRETRIEKLFFDYISDFQNFFNQKNIVVISKIKKHKNENINLSTFNLNQLLKDFLKYNCEYKRMFEENNINEELYKELRTLALFWENFAKDEFRNNKSKLYEIKLLQKNKDEEFSSYISKNLNKNKIILNNKTYFAVDIFKIDQFLNNLYENYKKTFNDIANLYNNFLLEEYQSQKNGEINIIYMVDNKLTKIGSTIKLKSISYSKNIEDLIKLQKPENYYNLIIPEERFVNEDSFMYNAVINIGKIEGIKLIYNYIISVNEELTDSEGILDETYKNWCEETSRIFEEEINGIIKCCDITFRKINKNPDYIQFTDKYKECLVNYRTMSKEVVKQKDISNFLSVDDLKTQFIELLGTVEL